MSICISKHVLATVKDPEIRPVFEYSLDLSKKHVERIKEFFVLEKFPLPHGLTIKDVNLDAPTLFTASFWLFYLHTMTNHGLSGYSLSFGTSVRKDIQDFYYQCNIDAKNKEVRDFFESALKTINKNYVIFSQLVTGGKSSCPTII